jgi:hypothetical protein
LTRSKANAILSDIRQSLEEGRALKPLSAEGRVDHSQNMAARGVQTSIQAAFGAGRNNNFGAITGELSVLDNELTAALQSAKDLDLQEGEKRELTPADIDRMDQDAQQEADRAQQHVTEPEQSDLDDDIDALSDAANLPRIGAKR